MPIVISGWPSVKIGDELTMKS